MLFCCTELIGLSFALHLVGLVTVVAVEALRRVVLSAVLIVKINETLLGIILDCAY